MPAIIYGAFKDLYEAGATQLYPLGQKLVTPDGSIFRYSLMGATVGVANKFYQSAADTVGHQSQAATVALAVSDTTITFRPTTNGLAVNELAGGTVLVEETDDLGHIYPVKSNTVASADADSVLTLADGVTVQVAVAVAALNVLTVKKNPWRDVILSIVTTPTATPAGIPRVIIAIAGFGWLQTRGISSCLVVDTWVLGEPLVQGKSVAGALGISTAATDAQVALVSEVAPAGDFGHVFLTID